MRSFLLQAGVWTTTRSCLNNDCRCERILVVDPTKNQIMVYDFENEDTEQYTFQDSVKVGIYEDLRIDFTEM